MSKKNFVASSVILGVLIVAVLFSTGTAGANPPEASCGMGEATSIQQNNHVAGWVLGENNYKGGLGSGFDNCYVRLWWDGQSVTFNSSDYVFYGYSNYIPLDLWGLSQQEAVELLLSSQEQAYMGPAGTPIEDLVEIELDYSPVKSAVHPEIGRVVFHTIGFVGQFEPGEYVLYQAEDWIFGPYDYTTNLTILP